MLPVLRGYLCIDHRFFFRVKNKRKQSNNARPVRGTPKSQSRSPVKNRENQSKADMNNTESSQSEHNSDSEKTDIEQPKGLIDGLSKFFTPSNKRKSRVSLNSSQPVADIITKSDAPKAIKSQHSKTQQAASRILKKSRKLKRTNSKISPTVNGSDCNANGLASDSTQAAEESAKQFESGAHTPPKQNSDEYDFSDLTESPELIIKNSYTRGSGVRKPGATGVRARGKGGRSLKKAKKLSKKLSRKRSGKNSQQSSSSSDSKKYIYLLKLFSFIYFALDDYDDIVNALSNARQQHSIYCYARNSEFLSNFWLNFCLNIECKKYYRELFQHWLFNLSNLHHEC